MHFNQIIQQPEFPMRKKTEDNNTEVQVERKWNNFRPYIQVEDQIPVPGQALKIVLAAADLIFVAAASSSASVAAVAVVGGVVAAAADAAAAVAAEEMVCS